MALSRSGTAYRNLAALGIELPPPRTPKANYRMATAHGGLLHLSGHGPVDADGRLRVGRVGDEIDVDEAHARSRLIGLNLLRTMEEALGTLDRITGIVKLFGMVYAMPDFGGHSRVIDGCSDLLVAVLGAEVGGHARSAIGVGSLPNRISVEIELIASFGD